MTNHKSRRRYRKTSGRRVWVFSELNTDLRPEQVAHIITTAGLEQARLEAAAQTQYADTGGETLEAKDDADA